MTDNTAVADATQPVDSGVTTQNPTSPGTTVTTALTEGVAEPVKADWPDEWRQKFAGDDTKKLDRLNRFTSPTAIFDSYLELEKKLSAGNAKKSLPDNPTPEQVTEWRKDNGIPEKPEEYDLKLDGGLVIGDEDKPFIDEYLKSVHAKNASPEVVKESIKWYLENREKETAQRYAQDKKVADETIASLKQEWGNDYEGNKNLIKGYLESETISNKILNARLGDGTPLASDKEVLNFLAMRARDFNPTAAVVSGSGDPMQSISEEKAAIEKVMGTKDYWKDEAKQARYKQLIEAEIKLKAKK